MLETSLEAPVREHLKKVYTCLSMSTLAAAAGAYIHVFTDILQSNGITSLLSLGLLFALHTIPHETKNQNLRLGLILGFSFFSGLGLGPLLNYVIMVDPGLVVTAFLTSCVVFVCFSFSAMYNRNGAYLYLGGILSSAVLAFLLVNILNLFIRSIALYQVYLYGGLALFCAFVLYDTQVIIQKRRRGDTDYIWHSVDLFLDFINMFQHILIILMQSQDTKRKKKSKD